MPALSIAFLGDIVGTPGRSAAAKAAATLRTQNKETMIIIANGENSKHGSGISPENFRELRRAGIDAVTLGDHVYKDRGIVPFLNDPGEPIARPANLSHLAPGKRLIRIATDVGPVFVLTVLGRMFMSLTGDNLFDAIDRELKQITEPNAIAVIEVHAEATSEKQAAAWHCVERWTTNVTGPRVVAVVGTHTHAQTNDAQLLDHSVAAITDLGMTGPHRSVIGRSISATLSAMREQNPSPLDIASDDLRASGALIRVDPFERRATAIAPFSL